MSLTDAAARNARPREKSYVASFPVGLYGALIVAPCAEEIAEGARAEVPPGMKEAIKQIADAIEAFS